VDPGAQTTHSPKLIEDTVLSWASTADKFGLKLVQVPIAEACAIDKTQPFRKPYRIKLKVPPPKGPLHFRNGCVLSIAQASAIGTCTNFSPNLSAVEAQESTVSHPGPPDRLYYQKAILRKFDFVLDFEASSAFPADDFEFDPVGFPKWLCLVDSTGFGDRHLYQLQPEFVR
jgi:hypothetical protein